MAGGLGVVVDGGVVLFSGHSVRISLANAITAAAFGTWAALGVAPLIALVAGACHLLDALRRGLWVPLMGVLAYWTTVAVSVSGVSHGVIVVMPPSALNVYAVRCGFVLGILVVAAIARSARPVARVVLGAAILVAVHYALIKEVHLPMRDLRDLLALLGLAAALGMVAPLRRRFVDIPGRRLGALVALAGLLPFGIVYGVDRASPGWRAVAWQYGIYESRLARFTRALIDFDLDGYSPVAWGRDCDDFDRRRAPGAHESRPGVDMNCNGATLPEHPTDEDRGLTPPLGSPDADEGGDAAPLVVVVTIDCWRFDAFRPDVMPNVTAFADRGVTFQRLYSAGTRTIVSMRLMDRSQDLAPTIATQLGASGVDSTAIFSVFSTTLNPALFVGFTTKKYPAARWDAATTTDQALEDLRASAGKPHLLWVHYIDTHAPYTVLPARFPYPADLGAPFGVYLAAVAFVDRELGRLLAAISSDTSRPTTVILTADHGEGFGRHNVRDHGISGYEQLIHVPGIIVAPGLAPRRYDELVSHRDIPPTLLGAFRRVGRSPEAESFGRSWLRLRAEATAPLHRFVVTRSARATRGTRDLMPMAVLVERDVKLIETFEDGLLEMYAPQRDPNEVRDEADSRPADVVRLRRELALFQDIDLAAR